MRKPGLIRVFAAITLLYILLLLAMNLTLGAGAEEQELKSELLKLMSVKEEMATAGIGVARVSDLINEGYAHLSNQNYNKTREVISYVYKARDAAFSAKSQLSLAKSLYAEIMSRNISLFENTPHIIEWNINHSKKEFEKENFEESLRTAEQAAESLLISIRARHSYLNSSLSGLNERASLLGLSTFRITTLKSLLQESLAKGQLNELGMIEKETTDIGTTISYYEEIKLLIRSLESKNLSSQRITDGLAEAEAKINIADYTSADKKLESLMLVINKALKLKEETAEFESVLEQEKERMRSAQAYGEKNRLQEAENMLKKSRYELGVGNYEEAEKQLAKAKQAFESEKARMLVESAAMKTPVFSIRGFLKSNWPYLLALAITALLALKLTQKAWSHELRKRKLARMEKELRITEKMVRELQKNYFVHKKMAREGYDLGYEALQERIIILKERIMLLNKSIKKEGKK